MDAKLNALRDETENAQGVVAAIGEELNQLRSQRGRVEAKSGTASRHDLYDRGVEAKSAYETSLALFASGRIDEKSLGESRKAKEAAERLGEEVTRAVEGFDRLIEAKVAELKAAQQQAHKLGQQYWRAVYDVHVSSIRADVGDRIYQAMAIQSHLQFGEMASAESILGMPVDYGLRQRVQAVQPEINEKYGLHPTEPEPTTGEAA